MKKIFTIAAALMASMAMMAVVPTTTLNPANVPADGWTGKYAPAYIENGDWVCFSPYEIYQSTAQTWAAKDNSGSTDGSWDAIDPFPAQSAWTTNDGKVATVRQGQKGPYYYRVTNTTDVAALVKSGSNKKRTIFLEAFELTNGVAAETTTAVASMESSTMGVISVTGLDAAKEYLIVVRAEDSGSGGTSSGNSNYYAIGFKTVLSTEPMLNVSPASVSLEAIASNTNPSTTVNFSGKNLTPGTYNLTVPNLAGLTVTPTAVTVGADGKLNAEVTIAYASTVDVAAGNTSLTLTIGELSAAVAINYSAVMTKQYITGSFNIEQLVMANSKGYNIKAAFDAAHIEYGNLDALDSLNNGKGAGRNEAYLGLKIKKTGGFIACWLPAGQTIRVKFGYVENNVLAIAGNDTMTLTPANKTLDVLEFTAPADTYVKIQTTSDKTVVLKQIKLNEAITDVLYKIAYNIGEGGTVTGWTVALPGEDVVMDITSNEGFALTNITYNGTAMVQTAPGAPISFTMPAEAVTIVASFGDVATAIDNTEEAVKTVKFFENGQLIILKNGVKYNAQGARL